MKNQKNQKDQRNQKDQKDQKNQKSQKSQRSSRKPNKKITEKIVIGKTMQMVRKSMGLTQEQVADALYLAPRYISDIERDKTKGSIDTLVKLCNIYRVTPTFILKDYLNTTHLDIIPDLVGFTQLTPKEKEIIIKLIELMNQQKHRTKK